MSLIGDILYTNKIGKLANKALDIHAQKTLIVTGNIANAQTPGYKAVEMKPFEAELKNAFRSNMKMTKTNANHINGASSSLKTYEPQLTTSNAPGRIDGNNVDLEKEVVAMKESSIMYQAIIVAKSKRGKLISSAMEIK
ncbi:hypothetical protein MNBD_NITROSPINAE01-1182 [hydrothermal vent metagenome]|uniref:Flagellar basal-body rod protein FlgB n=1 Tax=hydrothermal vent metagenome TaxID=652676 RepID=A0A3B1BS50_9ZZZZ